MKSPKQLLVSLLSGNITVYEDDNTTPIPILVDDCRFEKSLFQNYGVLVTVGPIVITRQTVMDIGAKNREYVQPIQLDVWVMKKHGANYNPERVKFDTCQEIDRILSFEKMLDPDPTNYPEVRFLIVSEWRDLDEPGTPEIFHAVNTVTVTYFKQKT